jgi:phage tail sheath protein FI
VPTSSAAFIGTSARGVVNKPVLLMSFQDFESNFGNLAPESEMTYAVYQFFTNGGREAWVVRIPDDPMEQDWRDGIGALDAVDLFNLLALPGIASMSLVTMGAKYCEQRRAFLVIDSPEEAKTPEQIRQTVESGQLTRSNNASVYYPWIKIADPLNNASPRLSAPSGSIAGLFSRIDSTSGSIWKAPAGRQATLIGVQGLEYALTDEDNQLLNARGINCLRSFPSGYLAWGARTLAGDDAMASDWKYIPIRRLALFLEESVYRGTKWAVFETNGEPLWAQLRESITTFMSSLWRMGAFEGRTPDEAYFVKCGNETTTQNDISLGIVNIIIGFAPLRSAEFVIIKIQQFTKRESP